MPLPTIAAKIRGMGGRSRQWTKWLIGRFLNVKLDSSAFLANQRGRQMKKLLLVSALLIAATNVYALSTSADGRAWNRASNNEKNEFAREAVRRLSATYPASELRACLDSFYAPPAPETILAQEIGQVAALCHTQLK
jgi:hypothetical protein